MSAFVPRSGRDISEKSNGVTLFSYILDLEAMVQSLAFAQESNDGQSRLQRALGLTGKEATLLMLLRDGRTRSKEQLLAGIYWRSNDDDAPDIKIVDVFICKIRKKIAGSGIEIGTAWGSGYYVENVAPLEAVLRGEAVNWAEGSAGAVRVGRPVGGVSRRKGSVRDAALDFLRQRADEKGVVRSTTRDLSSAPGVGHSGSVTFRSLEASGRLKVLKSPRAGGRHVADPVWVVKLAA